MSKARQVPYAMGDRVLCAQKLRRGYWKHRPGSDRGIKCWKPVPCDVMGVVVGYRTLQEGYTEYHGEDGAQWVKTGQMPCALVAIDLYKNPIYVPLDAMLKAD